MKIGRYIITKEIKIPLNSIERIDRFMKIIYNRPGNEFTKFEGEHLYYGTAPQNVNYSVIDDTADYFKSLERLVKDGLIDELGNDSFRLSVLGQSKVLKGGYVNEAKRVNILGKINPIYWIASMIGTAISLALSIYNLLRH